MIIVNIWCLYIHLFLPVSSINEQCDKVKSDLQEGMKAPVFGAKGSSSSHTPMLKGLFEGCFYFQQFPACSA